MSLSVLKVKENEPILFLDKKMGEFVEAYFGGYTTRNVRVRLKGGGRQIMIPFSSVMVFRGSYPKSVLPPPPSPPPTMVEKKRTYSPILTRSVRRKGTSSILSSLNQSPQHQRPVPYKLPEYVSRKQKQNQELMLDLHLLQKPMDQIRLFALDDFFHDKKEPRTMTYFLKAGGKAENFYSPNLDPKVVEAIEKKGGHSKMVKLYGFLLDEAFPEPMDALYLDYCGAWSGRSRKEKTMEEWVKATTTRIKDDIGLLFLNHHKLMADTVVLHLTIYKERGLLSDSMRARVLKNLEHWTTDRYGGTMLTLRNYDTETMWKLSFLLKRHS